MIEERIIVRVGKDQFNVIVGHVLNAEPLTKAEADRLAHSQTRSQKVTQVLDAPVVAAAAPVSEPVPDDPAPQPSPPPADPLKPAAKVCTARMARRGKSLKFLHFERVRRRRIRRCRPGPAG
jgi:hypothetical protein